MEEFALFTWTWFLLPAVWFWILVIGFFVLEFVCIAHERWNGALLITVLGFLTFQFCTEHSPLLWAAQNPGWLLIGLLGYIVAGAGYSVVDWTAKLSSARDEYKERKREFLEDHDQDPKLKNIPAALRAQWRDGILSRCSHIDPEQLKVRYHKAWLTWRIAFWPLAGAWMLLNDPIRAIAIRIRRMLNTLYENIYQKFTGTMQADIALIPEDLFVKLVKEVKLVEGREAWLDANVPDSEVRTLVEQLVQEYDSTPEKDTPEYFLHNQQRRRR